MISHFPKGCPLILQHDNGREFVNQVIQRLKRLWPNCVIVRGRARHPQSQGSVERANQDVEIMIGKWMMIHDATEWSVGIYMVAYQKNNRWHRTIKTTPYNLVYGQNPRASVTLLPFPLETLKNLNTEAELLNLLGHSSQEALDQADAEDEKLIEELKDYDSEEDVFNEIPGLMSNLRIVPPVGIHHDIYSDTAADNTGMVSNILLGIMKYTL